MRLVADTQKIAVILDISDKIDIDSRERECYTFHITE